MTKITPNITKKIDFVIPGGFLRPITDQADWDETIGVGAAVNAPVWQAVLPELVSEDELPAAVALALYLLTLDALFAVAVHAMRRWPVLGLAGGAHAHSRGPGHGRGRGQAGIGERASLRFPAGLIRPRAAGSG